MNNINDFLPRPEPLDLSASQLVSSLAEGKSVDSSLIARVCALSDKMQGPIARDELLRSLAQRALGESPESGRRVEEMFAQCGMGSLKDYLSLAGSLKQMNPVIQARALASFGEGALDKILTTRVAASEHDSFKGISLDEVSKTCMDQSICGKILGQIKQAGLDKEKWMPIAYAIGRKYPQLIINSIESLGLTADECFVFAVSSDRHLHVHLVCEKIDRFKFDQDTLFKIALQFSKGKSSATFCRNIARFNLLPSQQDRIAFEVSKNLKEKAFDSLRYLTLSCSRAYKRAALAALPAEEERFRLAYNLADKELAGYVHCFALDPSHCVELAKKCISENPECSAKHFKNFRIHNPVERFLLAKSLAGKLREEIFVHLPDFGIEDPEEIRAIAEEAVPGEENRYKLARDKRVPGACGAGRFLAIDQPHLVEVAFTIGYITPCEIKNFAFSNIDQIAALAIKSCQIKKVLEVLGIQDQDQIFYIAKRCAAESLNFDMSAFQIYEERSRFELAKMVGERDPIRLAQTLGKFMLQNEEYLSTLIEFLSEKLGYNLLTEMSQNSYFDFAGLERMIKQFLPDEESRYSKAKQDCAKFGFDWILDKQRFYALSNTRLCDFGVDYLCSKDPQYETFRKAIKGSESEQKQFAERVAVLLGTRAFPFVMQFSLEPSAIESIAVKAVPHMEERKRLALESTGNLYGVWQYADVMALDEESRHAVLMKAAQNGFIPFRPHALSSLNEDRRIAILNAAIECGSNVVGWMSNARDIKNQQAIAQLAIKAASKHPIRFCYGIAGFEMLSEEQLYRVLEVAYHNCPSIDRLKILEQLTNFGFTQSEFIEKAVLLFRSEFSELIQANDSKALDILQTLLPIDSSAPDLSYRKHTSLLMQLAGFHVEANSPLLEDLVRMKNPVARLAFMSILSRRGRDVLNVEEKKTLEILQQIFGLSPAPVRPFKDEMLKASFILAVFHLFNAADGLVDGVRPFIEAAQLFGGATSAASKRDVLEMMTSLILLGGDVELLQMREMFSRLNRKQVELIDQVQSRAKERRAVVESLRRVVKKEEEDLSRALETAFSMVFSESFDLAQSEDIARKYKQTFGAWRYPADLGVYYRDLMSLSEPDRTAVKGDFLMFVQEVLEGTFCKKRYTTPNFQMLTVGNEELKEAWKRGEAREVNLSLSSKSIDYRSELQKKLNEGHLPNEIAQEIIPFLNRENREPIPSHFSALQNGLILLARERGVRHLALVRSELERLGQQPELLNDVKGWMETQKEIKRMTTQKLLLVDTDHLETIFRMGTDVAGSCQRIGSGSADLNKGLLGTLLSEVRLIALIDPETGRIQGRALFRILDEGGKPALFFDRIYPNALGEEAVSQLIDFAKERAVSLGLPLYTLKSDRGEAVESETKLVGHGGRGTYSYVDDGGGNVRGGIFEIKGALRKI